MWKVLQCYDQVRAIVDRSEVFSSADWLLAGTGVVVFVAKFWLLSHTYKSQHAATAVINQMNQPCE